ncbi:phospholipase D family protein [Sinorhizobium terangae]|uniref:phospholipase D family protein n=1 Tax=Sinorhizobium terangae TaxID=110322 RepID=UPI0024B0BCF1|nr:phospholipase D family protein [Sinorhizobium terangae]WFU49144.1 phospholipase D family protein [Sinorhizobium terangae]
MEIKFLTATMASKAVEQFMDEYDEFYWAVAWGTKTPHADALFENVEKFRSVTFGIAFNQTHPDLVDRLVKVPNAYIASEFMGGTYHPKLYAFRSGEKAAAVVGSSNFTNGGLSSNLEAAVAITGSDDDKVFQDIFNFVRRSEKFGRPVTPDIALKYRASCKRASSLPKPPRDPLADMDVKRANGLTSPITSLNWNDYLRSIRKSAHHDVQRSLELLRTVQQWFSSVGSFSDLSDERRKAIAGVLGEFQKTDEQLNQDWGWFGSMRGAGEFAKAVGKNTLALAKAIDSIPRHGEVTTTHYQEFCRHFEKAFASSTRVGGVPTASRLLAMKRPDTFLCVSKPNIVRASRSMGFAKTSLTLENYWERVVEVIRACDWYNAPRPADKGAEIWDSRAAMLDAVFYEN